MATPREPADPTDIAHFEAAPPTWWPRVEALAVKRRDVAFEGTFLRTYRAVSGDRPKPGVVLVHGYMAHARCLSFLFPFLVRDFDLVAYDISGMGDSPMHPDFDAGVRGRELLAVAEDAGFLGRAEPAFVVSHSQGGHSAMSAIEAEPDAFAGHVLCDMMMMRPEVAQRYMGGRSPRPPKARPHKLWPDVETLLERYVLAPPQPCAEPFLLEYVARHSIRETDEGFCWKFDPEVRVTDGHPMEWWIEQPPRFAKLTLPRAIVHGDRSGVFPRGSRELMRELTRGEVPIVEVPEAHHHLMLDQPLAFASAVTAVLETFLAARS